MMSFFLLRIVRNFFLLSILAGTSSLAIAGDKTHWQNTRYLVDSFVEIALRSEYSRQPGVVRKWVSPVTYFVLHEVGDTDLHRRLIDVHFEHLARISGLQIKPTDNKAAANFIVVLASEERLKDDLRDHLDWRSEQQREKFFRESVCLATFSTKGLGTINRAVAIIPVDRARSRGKLVSCVVEELTQVMGLPNDSTKVFPSVFNDFSTDEYLTGLDYLMLKMLYDKRIKPGMDEKTARPILLQIARELERDGQFEFAEREAAADGLSALFP